MSGKCFSVKLETVTHILKTNAYYLETFWVYQYSLIFCTIPFWFRTCDENDSDATVTTILTRVKGL